MRSSLVNPQQVLSGAKLAFESQALRDLERRDDAALDEEPWHTLGLLMLRAEWEQQGRSGDFALLAESSSEARRTVMEMFPGALVTGVQRVKLPEALRKL